MDSIEKIAERRHGFPGRGIPNPPETHAACDGKQFSIGRKNANVGFRRVEVQFHLTAINKISQDVVVHYKTSGQAESFVGVMATTFGVTGVCQD